MILLILWVKVHIGPGYVLDMIRLQPCIRDVKSQYTILNHLD